MIVATRLTAVSLGLFALAGSGIAAPRAFAQAAPPPPVTTPPAAPNTQPTGKTPPTPLPRDIPKTESVGVRREDIKGTTLFNEAIPGQPLASDPAQIRTLTEAIEIAFQRNPNVLIAQERALRTVRTVDQILALKKPQITALGSYARLANASSSSQVGGLSLSQITNPFQVGLTSTPPGAVPITLSGGGTGSVGATTTGTAGQLGATNTLGTTSATPTRAAQTGDGTTRQTGGNGSGSGGTGTTNPGGGTGNNNNTFGNSGTNLNQTAARITVSQLIDITGIVKVAEDVGKLEEALTRLELARVRQETALQVKNGYYSVLRAQAFVAVNTAAVAQSEELLRVTTAQRDAGVAAQFDVLRAQTQLDNNRQALISSRNQVAISQNAFANTLGLDPSTLITPETPAFPPVPILDEAALLQTAITQRPEYLQADVNIIKADKNTRLAHRTLEPFVNVGLTGGYNPTSSAQDKANAALGVTLTVPLYDGGATKAAVESAKSDKRGALIQKDQYVRGIKAEVQQSVIAIRDATERSQAAGSTVTQAREALRLANVRFRAGVGTQLDVNDAQTVLTQAETNQVNAQYDYLGALARLSRAVGNPE